jgi:hypothetical protein
LPGLDGRSATARRFRDLVNAFVADMGGLDHCSEVRLGLVRRLAATTVQAEMLETWFSELAVLARDGGVDRATFLVHLSAPLIVLGLLGVNFAVLLLTGKGSVFSYTNQPSFRLLALCTLVFACLWWWTAGSGEVGFDSSTPTVFRSAASKIAAIGAPFYSFSLIQAAVMAASLLLIFVFLYGRRIWKDPFFLVSLMFFFLFLVFPKIVGDDRH